MHEITVNTVSAEEASEGIAELWAGGQMIAYTHYDDGDLMLRVEAPRDGSPVLIAVHSLTEALVEVDRLLALY